jgi:hypothetical protein
LGLWGGWVFSEASGWELSSVSISYRFLVSVCGGWVGGYAFRRRLRFVRLICCQPFWLSSWVSWTSSLEEEKLWNRGLLRESGGGEYVVWVWKLDVLGVGYVLWSLGFVGTRRVWAGSLLTSDGEEIGKCFLWFGSMFVVWQ